MFFHGHTHALLITLLLYRSIMSGVWESLFFEEKADYVTAILGSVTSLLTAACEVPCTLLTLVTTCLLMVLDVVTTGLLMSWDFTYQGLQQVSDLAGLQEWWSAEHTFWALVILMEVPVLKRRAKGFGGLFVLYSLEILKGIFVWGSFLFLLNGLQGGVIFGEKLAHPTLFALALTCHAFAVSFNTLGKEIGGYEHDGEIKDEKVGNLFKVVLKSVHLEALAFTFIGIFGMPQLDLNGDPKTWLVAAPLLLYATSYNEMLVRNFPFKVVHYFITHSNFRI